jgi:Na+/proline symporter
MAVFTPVLTIALIYVAFLAIGWVAGRRRADKTAADFMIAGRGLPLWLATLTMTATTIGRIRTRGLTEPALSDAVRTPSSPSHRR